MFKHYIKVFNQQEHLVSCKIVYQSLYINTAIMLKKTIILAIQERFFISYNNINFYKKVQD